MNTPTIRGLWLAIAVLAATIAGTTSGLLAWIGGMNPPSAILAGGGTFGGTVLLGLTILRFVTDTGE